MVAVLIRILALLGLLWTGKQVAHHVSSMLYPQQDEKHDAKQEINGEMVKDPVCLTYVARSIAVQRKFNGEIYYFCSEECADRFAELQHPTSP